MAGCATHWRTGDGVCQQCHDAEIASLRAKLAEAEKRAEHEHAEMQRQAQLAVDWMIDAQKATAACAEMREAAVGVDGRCRLCTARPREHRDNCALSRTDLGRWWASPEDTAQMVGALQMVEGDGEFDSLHEVTRKFVVDVLALIKKGGW